MSTDPPRPEEKQSFMMSLGKLFVQKQCSSEEFFKTPCDQAQSQNKIMLFGCYQSNESDIDMEKSSYK